MLSLIQQTHTIMTHTHPKLAPYSSLTIIQRINAKHNARAYAIRFGILQNSWMAMREIAGMDVLQHRYDTPFYFSGSNPLY
jgi:hypothetical protein